MAAVRELARYKAVVVISHRLANTVAARRIYVLDGGRVAGSGTHEELLGSCESYRRLWATQSELESFAGKAGMGEPSPASPDSADESEVVDDD